MTASTLHSQAIPYGVVVCPACRLPLESKARFCGECGQPAQSNFENTYQKNASNSSTTSYRAPDNVRQVVVPPDSFRQGYEPHERDRLEASRNKPAEALPSFVEVRDRRAKVDPDLARELGQLVVALIREHIMLVVHWLVFVATNSFGFWLAAKCYYEYNGDELTRFIMALTPIMFVNSIGLVCLAPIKGGKIEIHRIKERIAYVKVKIRHQNLI